MQGASDIAGNKLASYSEKDVERRDRVQAAISTLSGVGEALYYRAVAENDDMLSILADIVYTQIESLREITGR